MHSQALSIPIRIFLYLSFVLFMKQVQGDTCPAFPLRETCKEKTCNSFLPTLDTGEDSDENGDYYWDDDYYDEWEEERFEFIPGLHDEREGLAYSVSTLVEAAYSQSLHPTYKSLFGSSLYIKEWLPPEPLYLDFWKGFDYIFWWFEQPTHIKNFSREEVYTVRYKLHNIWKYVQEKFENLYEMNTYKSPYYFADKGLLALQLGKNLDAIECIKKIINNKEVENLIQSTWETAFSFSIDLGKAYINTNQFGSALEILDETIKKDPKNKQAYFERATAYFELGNFDESLQDYIQSGIKPTSIPNDCVSFLTFSLGLTDGILQGGTEAAIEYIPSLLSSMYGLGEGLWAFAQDPIHVSFEIVQATQDCIEFVRTHIPKEYLGKLVPELQQLIENWDTLDDREKGALSGRIIGKYGVDIFAGMGIKKGLRYYQNLKKANSVMTYETMKFSEANKKLIKITAKERAAIREKIVKEANLKVASGKQGKHVIGHNNYNIDRNRSIFEHPHPETLVKNYAGTGLKDSKKTPGTPGYKEIVNFKEFIGYNVDENTGIKTRTTWGKIHYAKDGIHIVPTLPRE